MLELTTVDGDGIAVTYRVDEGAVTAFDKDQNSSPANDSSTLVVRHGRLDRPMRIRLLDSNRKVQFERNLTNEERGTVLPVGQPWIAAIGSDHNLDDIGLKSARGGLPTISLSSLTSAENLPRSAGGYAGVDLLVMPTTDIELLRSISPDQSEAILEWLAEGGRIQIWLGANALAAAEIPWLSKLIPGRVLDVSSEVDPSVLESFVSSSQSTRLGFLKCARIEVADARVDLTLYSADRESLPFLMHSGFAAGVVDIVATDVNSSIFLDWPDRRLLLERTIDTVEFARARQAANSSIVNSIGYDDVTGQIRASLDYFESVTAGSITWLSVLVVLFLIIIGPFDYFVINRSLNRSVWTWLTLVLSCLSLLTLNHFLSTATKPNSTAINSFEIIDYSYDRGLISGHAFVHQYNGQADRFNLSATVRNLLPNEQATTTSQDSSTGRSPTTASLRWSGLPGAGLGGFNSKVRTDVGMPRYDIVSQQVNGVRATRIDGIGIPTAGTVAVRANWSGECASIADTNQLKNHPGSDLLEGSFTNPLDCDLMSPLLMYENWSYPLDGPLGPGESISLSIADSPRDLTRQLQQRRIVDDREQSVPWDPRSRRNLDRLFQLMSFYRASGGRQFVGLNFDYLGQFDLSEQLRLNRAIIIAEVEQPILKWKAQTNEQTSVVKDGYRSAFVRFILPVADQ